MYPSVYKSCAHRREYVRVFVCAFIYKCVYVCGLLFAAPRLFHYLLLSLSSGCFPLSSCLTLQNAQPVYL